MVNLDQAIDKVVIFLVIVALVPGALVSYFNVSTSGWDTATVAIWGILSILFIIGLFKMMQTKGGR
ncbi:hypothetical protein AYK24_08395 [Thermoplasmatales archaeon SG8-52-4]|nr:MAG: hypothetical protein AYK24_08395 [Thermoplasmatales archaeon SG8-52-4]